MIYSNLSNGSILYFLLVLLPISDNGGILRSNCTPIFAKKVFTQVGNKFCGIIFLLSSLILLNIGLNWFYCLGLGYLVLSKTFLGHPHVSLIDLLQSQHGHF